jgi:hypothetical protein
VLEWLYLFAKSGNAVKVVLATNSNLKKATTWFLAPINQIHHRQEFQSQKYL